MPAQFCVIIPLSEYTPPPSQGPPGHPAFPIWGPPGINFPDKPGYPPTVGGGPIYPSGPSQPTQPGFPTFPIWGPPGFNPIGPGYPPGIWGGPIEPIPVPPPDVLPKPPINLPPPGTPPEGKSWQLVYVYGVGWIWMLMDDAGQAAASSTSSKK